MIEKGLQKIGDRMKNCKRDNCRKIKSPCVVPLARANHVDGVSCCCKVMEHRPSEQETLNVKIALTHMLRCTSKHDGNSAHDFMRVFRIRHTP